MSDNKLLTAAIAATIAVGLSAASVPAQAAGAMEKCYGVAKEGMNDCGSKTHACAGQSTKDGDSSEWVYMPKGTCNKIVGGSTSSS